MLRSALLALALVVTPTTAAAAVAPRPDTFRGTLGEAIGALKVASEDRTGYERSKFRLWTDADGDGCNSRYEVLIAEAKVAPTVGAKCKLAGGSWHSYYDDKTWSKPEDLDIDHMVPLAEAWDSGARTWTAGKREAYANDLDEDKSLVAVTDKVNQAKGDKDIAEWMPPLSGVRCRYLTEFVVVKVRWRLTVDAGEQQAMRKYADGCGNAKLFVVVVD